jgi:hypothetical protein
MRNQVDNPISEQDSEEFAEIWKRLNHNQRRFVVQMAESSNKKEAALAIGLHETTVYNWPKDVDKAVTLYHAHVSDAAAKMLADGVAKAALIKLGGLDSSDEKIRQSASSEILDRVLGKAAQVIEAEGGFDVNLPGVEEMLKKVYGSEEGA